MKKIPFFYSMLVVVFGFLFYFSWSTGINLFTMDTFFAVLPELVIVWYFVGPAFKRKKAQEDGKEPLSEITINPADDISVAWKKLQKDTRNSPKNLMIAFVVIILVTVAILSTVYVFDTYIYH